MNEWFECKIKFDKTLENGMIKKVSELYLVNALNFTEAEERITEEQTPYMTGEFEVMDIKRAKYAEIIEATETEAELWFKAKLLFVTLDEKNGQEKKTAHLMLVQAKDIQDALTRLHKHMQGGVIDYTISAINETAILDIYPFKVKEN